MDNVSSGEEFCTKKKSSAANSDSDSLISMLKLKSADTGSPEGHSERVASYAVGMGSLMDFSEKDLKTLKSAAILHDVGKVGISSQIVNKLGRLSDREFEIMKLHSTIAVHMLERVEALKDTLPAIKHHHERFDGKGYPDGLSGYEIPLMARIISVAETFDILMSDLPWRDSLSINEALKELKSCSGTQFDPGIVDTLIYGIEQRKITVCGISGSHA